jgi:localization factor PodJL
MVEAYKWFAVAASSGDAEAAKRRDIIAAALGPSDLEAAQAAAASFQPAPIVSEANEVNMPDGGWGDLTSEQSRSADDGAAPPKEAGAIAEAAGDKAALSENDRVALVQKLLAERGFDPGPADGLLGAQTIQAIAAFQEDAGLPRTGRIDSGLVAALQENPG